MNNLLSLSHNILLDIIEKDLSFSLAIGNATRPSKNKKIDSEIKNGAVTIVGCALRHQIIFDELIKRSFGDVPNRVKSGLYIYLANKIFLEKVSEKEAFEFMKQKFIDSEIEFDNEKYNVLDESTNDKTKLVPAEYDQKSLEFLSFRFNTPLWLVKMWKKQFGPQLTYPILLANGKGINTTYRVNTSLINEDAFIETNNRFAKTETKGLVTYVGEKFLKKETISNCKFIFEYSKGYKKLFDSIDCDPFRGIAFYIGSPTNAFLELMAQYSKDVKFEIVANKGDAYFSTKRLVERNDMGNVAIYEAAPSSIITCISKPVHTFIVMPDSSNFAQIRITPDYLLHFNKDKFDEYLSAQRETLEEAAQFVEDGGNLVYAVPTINHKEGRAQILNFLNTHKEFSMVEDRQIFPFDKLDSTLYYAILRKEEIKND